MTTAACDTNDLYTIGDAEFGTLREMLYRECGVSLSDTKRALVCSRLARRLRSLQLSSYAEYIEYLDQQDSNGSELQMLVNCLTTNKTDFLREPHHFDFLRDVVIPEARRRAESGAPRKLRIWSAACSEGDEPYTIAMTLLEHLPQNESWDVRILASDINTEVLGVAKAGEYPIGKFDPLPEQWRKKYVRHGIGNRDGLGTVCPEAKQLITFRQINLMEEWPHKALFDVIFCRNVIIYFDQPTQERLLKRLSQHLSEHSYLMLGHSESSPWLVQSFESLGKTVFKRRASTSKVQRTASQPVPAQPTRKPQPPARKPVQQKPKASQPRKSVVRPVSDLPSRNILAGQTYVLNKPGEITTVLGSCVAVCLYDPQTGVGGMNHFMLPSQSADAGVSARYGIHAMELLITNIMKSGGERGRLVAKAFGGANLLQLNFSEELSGIGQQNVKFVREFLSTEEIPLAAEKLGGEQPLRIFFQPHNGRVSVKTLRKAQEIATRECSYKQSSAQKAQSTGDVTFFK
ncbi:CheR family methyltransferase [Aeoliella sp.]|uniref:CheR family methyltransferase n=1 Tax=Aeoliella sp. TaxID=2795800 RepID=UPI003CCBB0CE